MRLQYVNHRGEEAACLAWRASASEQGTGPDCARRMSIPQAGSPSAALAGQRRDSASIMTLDFDQ